jgi:hypothetical protein
MNPSIRPRASSEMPNAGVSDEIESQGSSIVDIVRVPAENNCHIAASALVSVVNTISYGNSVKSVHEATPSIRIDPSGAGENSQPVSLLKPAARYTNVLRRAGGVC